MSKWKVGFGLVAILIILILRSSLTQPGVDDLSVTFQEIAFARNENNTGPVKRRYVVSVTDTIWNELERYGGFLPHNKLGETKVYFFLLKDPAPQSVSLVEPPFSDEFRNAQIAEYTKDAMGQVSFIKY